MSERYEVRGPEASNEFDIIDMQAKVMRDNIVITVWSVCPDAEKRAGQLCAELNAARGQESEREAMSDKPLAEKWCEESKRCKQIADECGDDSVFAQSVRYWMCADELKKFAAKHLTEQTETSEEIKQKLREVAIDLGHKKADYAIAKLLGTTAQWTINAERRRIREMLVGKETK